MKIVVPLVGTFFLAAALSASLSASIINFDDIDASLGDVPLEGLSPYQGLTWTGLSAYTSVPGFPGFNNGIVSSANASYTTGNDITSVISRASGFDFTSAYLGAGWYDGLNVTLLGIANGVQSFAQSVTVNTQAPQLFTFNFTGITELDIFSVVTGSTTDPYGCGPSGCNQVTLDDVNVTLLDNPSNSPEPGTLPMFCLALVALAMIPRLRRSFRRF